MILTDIFKSKYLETLIFLIYNMMYFIACHTRQGVKFSITQKADEVEVQSVIPSVAEAIDIINNSELKILNINVPDESFI